MELLNIEKSMEINFYGVWQEDIQKVVAILLEKAYKTKKNSVLLVANLDEAKNFDNKLWNTLSWLPHCLMNEKKEEDTPVVIHVNNDSQSIQVKNQASLLFVFDMAQHYDLEKFEKVCIVFSLKNDLSLKTNRNRWKDLQQKNYTMRFYKQNEQGKFEETKL